MLSKRLFVLSLFATFAICNLFGNPGFEYGVSVNTISHFPSPGRSWDVWVTESRPLDIAGSGYNSILATEGNNYIIFQGFVYQLIDVSQITGETTFSFDYRADSPVDFFLDVKLENKQGPGQSTLASFTISATTTWQTFSSSFPFTSPGSFDSVLFYFQGSNIYLDNGLLGCPVTENIDYTLSESLSYPSSSVTVDTACVAASNSFPSGLTFPDGINPAQQNLIWYEIASQPTVATYQLTVDTCSSDFDTVLFIIFYNLDSGIYSLEAYVDDTCGLGASVTLTVDDDSTVLIAAGGIDGTDTGSLTISISSQEYYVPPAAQLKALVEDVEEIEADIDDLHNFVDNEIDTVIAAVAGVSDTLDTVSSNVLSGTASVLTAVDGVASTLSTVGANVLSGTSDILGAISGLSSTLGTVNTNVNSITTTLGGVSSTLDTVATTVGTIPGSFSTLTSYIQALMASNSAADTDRVFQQYLYAAASSVPAQVKAPLISGGSLEDVRDYVISVYDAQLALASANGGSSLATCPSTDSYCKFFFKTAKNNYLSKINKFNTNYGNGLYANAFTELQNALTSLYMN